MNGYGHLINYLYRRYARSSNLFSDVRKCILADRGVSYTEHSSIIRFLLTVQLSWTGQLDFILVSKMVALSSDQAALELLLGEMARAPIEVLKRSGVRIVQPDPAVLPILQPEMEFENADSDRSGAEHRAHGNGSLLGDREEQEEVSQGS